VQNASTDLQSSEPVEALLPEVYTLLAEIVNQADVDHGYCQTLQRVLDTAQIAEQVGFCFTALPLLACQAAGGQPRQAIPVAAAWKALHIAAQLLDDVEDGDVARMSTAAIDAAHVINLATGFIVAANVALQRLPPALWRILQEDFNHTTLRMAGGQHADLNRTALLDLAEYFQLMVAKSGSFFALAARAGAQCGTSDQIQIAKFDQFGYNVGILIQVTDDLADFHKPSGTGSPATGRQTLPTVYALNVASPAERDRLMQLLAGVASNKEAEAQARQLLVALGAEVYLRAEASTHRNQALATLAESVTIIGPSDKPLRDWLAGLTRAI
jgi:geranylgeranyl diphosphate synthase, type I